MAAAVHPGVVCGFAIGAVWLAELREGPREGYVAPPPASIPSVASALDVIDVGAVCGIPIRPDDGPKGAAPVAPGAAPWRYYSAQLFALYRVKGGWITSSRRYPNIDLGCLIMWAREWRDAYLAWLFATVENWLPFNGKEWTEETAESAVLTWEPEVEGAASRTAGEGAAVVRAGRDLLLEINAARYLMNVGGATRSDVYTIRIVRAISRLAIEIGNTGHLPPLIDKYERGVGGYLAAYNDNLSKYVVGPAAGAATGLLGWIAGGAIGLLLDFLLSPIGALLIVGLLVWQARRGS